MLLQEPRQTYLGNLPPGEPGTRATLRAMKALVEHYKTDDTVRSAALDLVRGLPPKAYGREVRALFEFVRDDIRYVRDVYGVETLQTPVATLDIEQGDCDDKSTLLAALLESIGHPTRFIAVGFTGPGQYSHVYVETKVGPNWIPLDATVSTARVGWRPPRPALASMVVHNGGARVSR